MATYTSIVSKKARFFLKKNVLLKSKHGFRQVRAGKKVQSCCRQKENHQVNLLGVDSGVRSQLVVDNLPVAFVSRSEAPWRGPKWPSISASPVIGAQPRRWIFLWKESKFHNFHFNGFGGGFVRL